MKQFQYIMVLTFVLLLARCKHEPIFDSVIDNPNDTIDNPIDTTDNPIDTTDNPIDTIDVIPCSPDSVYFENDVMPIIQSNCAFSGCHGDGSAQDGVNLSNYNSIIQTGKVKPFDLNDSELYEVITETDPDKIMPPPPYSALTAEQIQIIATWINQGALNNGCTECDTDAVTFSTTISPIIQNSCQGCHNASSPQAGISLTNYTQISAAALNGSLYGTINHESGYTPMPFNGQQLPQCDIDQVAAWINDGAPNN